MKRLKIKNIRWKFCNQILINFSIIFLIVKIDELAIELNETEERIFINSIVVISIRFTKLILIYFNIAVTTSHVYETFCICRLCNVIFLIACKNSYISYEIIHLAKIKVKTKKFNDNLICDTLSCNYEKYFFPFFYINNICECKECFKKVL